MAFEIEGTLFKIYPTESKSASFSAREFVISIPSGSYSEYPKFQLVQDRVSAIDPFSEGDQIKVFFDLKGREWQGKYFTNLNCWRIERASGATSSPAPTQSAPAARPPAAVSSSDSFPSAEPPKHDTAENDDLPF